MALPQPHLPQRAKRESRSSAYVYPSGPDVHSLSESAFPMKTQSRRLRLPRKKSGHEGVHDAVQPAWNDSGAVFEQTAEALGYALLDAHRFHRHGLRIEAELFEHRCVRKPGCQYSDVDT